MKLAIRINFENIYFEMVLMNEKFVMAFFILFANVFWDNFDPKKAPFYNNFSSCFALSVQC